MWIFSIAFWSICLYLPLLSPVFFFFPESLHVQLSQTTKSPSRWCFPLVTQTSKEKVGACNQNLCIWRRGEFLQLFILFLGNRLYLNCVWMEIFTKNEDVNLLLKSTFRFCFPLGSIFTPRGRRKRKKHVSLRFSLEGVTADTLQVFLLCWGWKSRSHRGRLILGIWWTKWPSSKGVASSQSQSVSKSSGSAFSFLKAEIGFSCQIYVNIFTSQMKQSRRTLEIMVLNPWAWI